MGERPQDGTGEVWQLRRAVIQHPVHRWATGPADRKTLQDHKVFCQWGSTILSASLPTGRSPHDLADVTEGFGTRGLAAAGPLVDVVGQLVSKGSEPARLGALAFGLPCCHADQAWALNRLAMLTTNDPSAHAEAVVAAIQVLEAQVALYDAAAEAIRRRHMTMHPSAWRARAAAPARTQLQPAG